MNFAVLKENRFEKPKIPSLALNIEERKNSEKRMLSFFK